MTYTHDVVNIAFLTLRNGEVIHLFCGDELEELLEVAASANEESNGWGEPDSTPLNCHYVFEGTDEDLTSTLGTSDFIVLKSRMKDVASLVVSSIRTSEVLALTIVKN